MPSPFPGMDPYLESHWGDVHTSLVLYIRDQLQGRLPGDLRARVEERVFVDSPQEIEREIYPDVRVVESGRGGGGPLTATVPAADPVIVTLTEDEPVTERFVEVIDIGSGRQVVTVLEVLSPSNKRPGAGQQKYIQKQQELLEGRVNLVEIDLLLGGRSVLSIPPQGIPRSHRTRYQVVVRRGRKLPDGEAYAVPFRQRLPVIRVPLREKDNDVSLDLQAALDLAYNNGGYADDLDYESEPEPPFPAEDAAWADALLREKGVRKRPPAPPPRRRRKPKT